MNRKQPALAALAAVLLSVAPATADTDGLAFGIGLQTNRIAAEKPANNAPSGTVFVDETAGGANLWAGYGFTPSFTMRLMAAAASHGTSDPDVDIDWGGATVEAMYLFRNPSAWRPYVVGGFGGYSTRSRQDNLDFEVSGPGLLAGAGVLHSFNDTWALDLSVRASFVNWKDTSATFTFPDGTTATVQTPIEDDGAALDLGLGLSWWL